MTLVDEWGKSLCYICGRRIIDSMYEIENRRAAHTRCNQKLRAKRKGK